MRSEWDKISLTWNQNEMRSTWLEIEMRWDENQVTYIRKITKFDNKKSEFLISFFSFWFQAEMKLR